jgi:hypothetical protein
LAENLDFHYVIMLKLEKLFNELAVLNRHFSHEEKDETSCKSEVFVRVIVCQFLWMNLWILFRSKRMMGTRLWLSEFDWIIFFILCVTIKK